MEYNEFRSIVSAAEYEFFMSGFIKIQTMALQ